MPPGLSSSQACALVAALVHQATAAQSVGPPRQNSGRRLAADPLGGGPLFWRVAGLVVQGVECEGEGGAAACPPADAIRDVVLGKVGPPCTAAVACTILHARAQPVSARRLPVSLPASSVPAANASPALPKVANITILSVGASKRAAPAWAGSDLSTIFCGPGYEACLPSWPRGAAEEEELWRRVTHLPSCPLAGGNQLTLRVRAAFTLAQPAWAARCLETKPADLGTRGRRARPL